MEEPGSFSGSDSSPSPERGPLRGFFCEHYTPATPPDLPRGSMPKPDTKPEAPAQKRAPQPRKTRRTLKKQ